MNAVRDRVKEHFPTVLLTLLSIVQALALELLWSHIQETPYLYVPSWTMAVAWVQIISTFIGLVLIWVVYASNVMRFSWVPTTSDSVYPFIIGLLEFMLVECLRPDRIGHWFITIAIIFALMTWAAQTNMRRARQEIENVEFFRNYEPATLRDFYPQIAIIGGLLLAGTVLLIRDDRGLLTMLSLLAANLMLGWQFYSAARYWKQSVEKEPEPVSK